MADTYLDILRRVGWPTDVLVLDFENYFDADYTLRKMSTVEFITDQRYECLGLAHLRVRPGRPTAVPGFDHDVDGLLTWCRGEYGENLEGCTVVCQNAKYDGMVLTLKHGITPPYVVDTLGLGRGLYHGYRNDMATLCKRLHLNAKGDTNQFRGLRWTSRLGPPGPKPTTITRKKDTRTYLELRPGLFQEWMCGGLDEDMRAALADYAKNDALVTFKALEIMLPQFSRPEVELLVMRQTLELFWKPRLAVDCAEGEEIAALMEAEETRAAEKVGLTPEVIRSAKFPAVVQEALGDEPLPMKQGARGPIPALAKEDEGRKALLAHPDQRVRDLMNALIAVKSWPLHSKRVRKIMAQARALGGLLAVALKYMGAHTGRWSGDENVNLQNLSKRTLIELLRRIRRMLIARPGRRLVVTDACQIEARMLAWLAGQNDLVRAFAAGDPIYCQFAAEVLGVSVRKARRDDPPFIKDTMTRYRNLGKVGVLGCGYGMGPDRCYDYARQVYHVDIDRPTSRAIVKHYREKNDRVVKLWGDVEGALKYVTRYPSETTELPRGLRFWNDAGVVTIGLPSGRELYYHEMALTLMQKRGFDRAVEQLWYPDPIKPGSVNYVWGGLAVENIVQAMARDVLAEAMLLADEWGKEIDMRVVLHVHDEMVGDVPAEHAERGLQLQIAALSVVPDWAVGCPLAAEGEITERYGA